MTPGFALGNFRRTISAVLRAAQRFIFRLRDESLADSDNLPDPDVLAQEIVVLRLAQPRSGRPRSRPRTIPGDRERLRKGKSRARKELMADRDSRATGIRESIRPARWTVRSYAWYKKVKFTVS